MPDLIINDVSPRIQASAAAGQTVFTYPFLVFDATDLAVYKRHANASPDDVLDLLVLNTDYTVTGVGQQGGGTIVLTYGAALNDVITIERDMALERTTDYNDAGSFKASSLNKDFDRDVMMAQQVNEKIVKRGILYNHSATIPPGMNLLPVLGAGQIWKADQSGEGIVAATLEESADVNTLRSELASNSQASPGAALVGFYSAAGAIGSTTVDDYLKALADEQLSGSRLVGYNDTVFGQGEMTVKAFLDNLLSVLTNFFDTRYDARYLAPITFRIKRTTNQNLVSSGPNVRAAILFNSVTFDNDSMYESANGKITPKKAGFYVFFFNGLVTINAAGAAGLAISKNAVEDIASQNLNGVLAENISIAGGCAMNGTTDYIQMMIGASGGPLTATYVANDESIAFGFIALKT